MKRDEYVNAIKHITLSEEQKERLLRKTLRAQKSNRRCNGMMRKKKMALVAAAAVVAVSVTAGAASTLISGWFGSSSGVDYTSLPTAEQCRQDLGYTPTLLEQFDNGYVFKDGVIVENRAENDNGNTVKAFQSLDMEYVKGNDIVTFSQMKYDVSNEAEGKVVDKVDGVEICYSSNTYCFVPADYQLSAEEKQQEKSGEVIFSYGADEVSKQQVQTVSWNEGELHCSLMQMDGALSQQEMVSMAEEAIVS